jgi:hypothetical protein
MIGVAILREGLSRPQRLFAGLPHSFRSRMKTGLVEDVSKSRPLTEPA